MNNNKDYYKILEIDQNAENQEIKKAFRKLSMKYHPDKNNGDDTKFKEINEAYETLGDKEQKIKYDSLRGGGGHNIFMNHNMNGMSPNINEMFNMFFKQGGENFGGPNVQIFRNGVPVNLHKPVPIIKNINITLEQSYHGYKYPLAIERWIVHENIKQKETETIYIDIPCGADNNEIIILRNKGNVIDENNKGDIKVCIHITNETIFERKGLDLIIKKNITLKEALCGFVFEIKHLNNKTFKINNEQGNIITPNYNKLIHNLGMKRQSHSGNLIIIFNIHFPTQLSIEQTNKIKNIL